VAIVIPPVAVGGHVPGQPDVDVLQRGRPQRILLGHAPADQLLGPADPARPVGPADAGDQIVADPGVVADPFRQPGGVRPGNEHHLEPELPVVLGLERARGPFGDQPSGGDDGQAVHRPLGLHHVVGDQEHRAALLPEGADLVPQQPAAQGVHVVGRLVQDHHPPRLDRHHGKAHQPLDPT
jgi:hypothetical protein